MTLDLRNGEMVYRVSSKVADSGDSRIYTCLQVGTNRQCLLQIANSVEGNGTLEKAAFILRELKHTADELEAEYAKVSGDTTLMLNYALGFPELVDSFVCKEQGLRRVNILAFRNVDEVSRMVPLSNLTTKDRLRVDLRTSAWIMGKLLKFLTFVHNEGIFVGLRTGSNILIEPSQHYVMVFDLSLARTASPEGLSMEDTRQDIANAAKAVISVLGGDCTSGIVPDVEPEEIGYVSYLMDLANGGKGSALTAHEGFYKVVHALWPREFYPFTTKPLIG